MSKETMYCQCELSRKVAEGICHEVSWIPTKFAQVGKYLELLNENGIWENGWRVDSAGGSERSCDIINKRPVFGSLDEKARSRKTGASAILSDGV